jgi:DNA-binding LacI/PurR family transcriptional regulator
VIGFDDISLARFSSPLLTTYATPITEVGEKLCRLLFDRIDGLLPSERQHVFVYGELKVRKSTAPPRTQAAGAALMGNSGRSR